MKFIFLILVFVVGNSYSEEVAFTGICSQASTTNARTIDENTVFSKLKKEILTSVILDKDEFTLVSLNNIKNTYAGQNNSISPKPEGEWHFTNGLNDVNLFFFKDQRVIFNLQSKTSSPYFWGSCALVESPVYIGTLFVEPSNKTTQGELNSCGIEFGATLKDFAYNQGKRYYIAGSFGLNKAGKNRLLPSLKVITQRISPLGKHIGNAEKPYFAYLKTSDGKKANQKSIFETHDSDTPGGLFTIFNLDDVSMDIIFDSLLRQEITIVFNRSKGGQDIELHLDLSVESVDSNTKPIKNNKTVKLFNQCLQNILKDAKL